MSSVVVRSLDKEKILAHLRTMAAATAAARPEVREVRLFGSLARGERNPYADADILVVLDASNLPYRERVPLYKPLGGPVPMDLIICTQAELDGEVAAANPFVLRMLRESLVLYSRLARQSSA